MILFMAAMLLILVPSTESIVAAASLNAVVTVHCDMPGPPVENLIFGSNVQWEHAGDGLYDIPSSTIKKDIKALISHLGITALRYPGGTLSDTFDWRASVGPMDKRGEGITFAGEHEKIYFGLDEFLRFCEERDIVPVLTVNFNITPDDAASLVQYVNGNNRTEMGQLRAANGHKLPYGVRYFEIGNEIYSHTEPGHCTVEKYAAKFRAMRNAMRAVDASISVGACCEICFQKAPWASSVLPDLLKWNSRLAQLAGKEIDFLSCHFYGPFDTSPHRQKIHNAIFALPVLFSDTIKDLRSLFPAGKRIAVTEYNLGFGDKAPLDPMVAGYESGLFTALMLQTFVREGVLLANHWSILGNDVFGMIESAATGRIRPSGVFMKAVTDAASNHTMKVDVSSPTYDITGLGSVPAMKGIPIVHVTAFSSVQAAPGTDYRGDMAIMVINTSQADSVNMAVELKNHTEHLNVRQALVYEQNGTVAGIDAVRSVSLPVTVKQHSLGFVLPSCSFAVIKLSSQDVAPESPKNVHLLSYADSEVLMNS